MKLDNSKRYKCCILPFLALPSIKMVPSGIVFAKKDQRLEFSCFSETTAELPVWSTKSGTSLPAGVSQDRFGRLIFAAVSVCQSGIYTCQLSNQEGSISKNIVLVVDLTASKTSLNCIYAMHLL